MPWVHRWQSPSGLDVFLECQIHDSKVDVRCDMNRFDQSNTDDLVEVYPHALRAARLLVDLLAFSTGTGLAVILDSVVNPDGSVLNILGQDQTLYGLCTVFSFRADTTDPDLFTVLKILAEEPNLAMALNDLTSTVDDPDYIPIACGRAMEHLRLLTAPDISPDNKKAGWIALGNALNIGPDYLSLITEYSHGPRHGDFRGVSTAKSFQVRKMAWTIMNRFLELRKCGRTQLSIADFPALQ